MYVQHHVRILTDFKISYSLLKFATLKYSYFFFF